MHSVGDREPHCPIKETSTIELGTLIALVDHNILALLNAAWGFHP